MKTLSRKPTGPFSRKISPASHVRSGFVQPGVGVTEWQVVGPQSSNRSVDPVFIDILEYWNYFTTFELGKVLKRSTWHLKATIRFGMLFGKKMITESQFNHQKQEIILIFLVYALARESHQPFFRFQFVKRFCQETWPVLFFACLETPGQGCWWNQAFFMIHRISYQILLVLQLATKALHVCQQSLWT